jgi:hypothetical protein
LKTAKARFNSSKEKGKFELWHLKKQLMQ